MKTVSVPDKEIINATSTILSNDEKELAWLLEEDRLFHGDKTTNKRNKVAYNWPEIERKATPDFRKFIQQNRKHPRFGNISMQLLIRFKYINEFKAFRQVCKDALTMEGVVIQNQDDINNTIIEYDNDIDNININDNHNSENNNSDSNNENDNHNNIDNNNENDENKQDPSPPSAPSAPSAPSSLVSLRKRSRSDLLSVSFENILSNSGSRPRRVPEAGLVAALPDLYRELAQLWHPSELNHGKPNWNEIQSMASVPLKEHLEEKRSLYGNMFDHQAMECLVPVKERRAFNIIMSQMETTKNVAKKNADVNNLPNKKQTIENIVRKAGTSVSGIAQVDQKCPPRTRQPTSTMRESDAIARRRKKRFESFQQRVQEDLDDFRHDEKILMEKLIQDCKKQGERDHEQV